MATQNEPVAASAEQLLALYPRLGVPHFQRGLVWNEEGTSLLLESLYTGTPCGNIILWQPRRPEVHGVPLGEGGRCQRLIVDGQQRTRMLYEAFCGSDCSWCLDLTAEPLVSVLLAAEPRSRLFVAVSAAHPSAHHRVRANLIPLSEFWDETRTLAQLRERVTVAEHGEPLIDEALRTLRARVRQMRQERVFAVITLCEDSNR